MTAYEVAAENGTRVRVDAADETEAFVLAVDLVPAIEQGSVIDATDLPVGWDGGDAED